MKLNKIQFRLLPHNDLFHLKLLKNNNMSNPLWEDVTTGYLGVIFERIFKYMNNVESVKITITYKK